MNGIQRPRVSIRVFQMLNIPRLDGFIERACHNLIPFVMSPVDAVYLGIMRFDSSYWQRAFLRKFSLRCELSKQYILVYPR